MIPCFNCGQCSYLIRGLCEDCAPDLHKLYRGWSNYLSRAESRFLEMTGKSSLEDWDSFETFLSQVYCKIECPPSLFKPTLVNINFRYP